MGSRVRLGNVRLEVLVRPNAMRVAVGGEHDGALVVRVVEPADRGRATGAALRAVAEALGIPARNVTLIRGAKSRRKVVELSTSEEEVEVIRGRLKRLLEREAP